MALLSKLFNKDSTDVLLPDADSPVMVEAASQVDFSQIENQAHTTQDIELRLQLAIDGPTARIRQLAAEGVEDPEALKRLLRDARGKDKNVYRIVRQKCDVLLEIEKDTATKQAHAAQVCEAIERHVYKPFDSIYVATLDHHVTQWQLLASVADVEITDRTTLAIDRCREHISTHLKKIASEASQADAIANADTHRAEVQAAMITTLASVMTVDTLDAAETSVSDAERLSLRWQETLQFKAASKVDQQRFNQLKNAVQSLLSQIRKHGTLQQQMAALQALDATADDSDLLTTLDKTLAGRELLDAIPESVSNAIQVIAQRRRLHADREATQQHWQKQTAGLIRKALRALQDGQSAQAAGMRKAIEEKMAHGKMLPASVASQLNQLDTQLNELRDWKSYAVAPKRQQLIEHMESLAAQAHNATDPNELAERIKKLQDEWKIISKGNTDNTDAEWQRFHTAAQTAYEPCREHFTKLAQQRQHNLELRQALLARLSAFSESHNWEQPQWREVAKAVRESQRLWRSYQPVERAANKALQEQFDVQLSALQTRLDGEYERNSTAKKRIVARALGLLSVEGRDAVDEVKRLQAAWKDIGPAAHDDEQALWQEFRQHCDSVFAKRQQQHVELVAALQSTKQQAEALCEQVEQIQRLSEVDLLEAAKKLPEFRQAFAALGELPRANARNIESRFDRALQAIDRQLARQREIDKARAWDNVLTWADKNRAYRLAQVEGASVEQLAALKQAAQDYIDTITTWPKTVLQSIKQQLTQDEAHRNQDVKANTAILRELCVRAEILTDTPTLEADQSARREYQMKRLTQGFGKGAQADTIESLILEWIAVGASSDLDYAALMARFNRCRTRQ
jgi:DNA repair protein SbcC/Rad50